MHHLHVRRPCQKVCSINNGNDEGSGVKVNVSKRIANAEVWKYLFITGCFENGYAL